MQPDDDQLRNLLYGVSRGEEEAFATLYRHTAARLYPVCMHLLGQREAAEEAVQDAFVRIWHQADRYSPDRGTVLTWMIGIARYRAIDQLRYRARRPETNLERIPEQALADAATGPLEHSALATDADALARCMGDLGNNQRSVIRLAFLQGLTHDEICRQLDSPLGSVKSWIRRGLQALKRCLQR